MCIYIYIERERDREREGEGEIHATHKQHNGYQMKAEVQPLYDKL